MIKSKKVYCSKNISMLKAFFEEDDIDFKIDVIDCYRLYDLNYEFFNSMKKLYNCKLSKKQKIRLDYLQYLYWLEQKDDYNLKKVKNRLKTSGKYSNLVFEFHEHPTIYEHAELFDKCNFYDLKKLYKNKKYRHVLEYLFLESQIDDSRSLEKEKYFSKKLLNSLNLTIKKKKLNIIDVFYLFNILNILDFFLIRKKIYDKSFFLPADIIEKIINSLYSGCAQFKDLIKEETLVNMYETIANGFSILQKLYSVNEKKCSSITEQYDKFINEHNEYLLPKTIFMYNLIKDGSITDDKIIKTLESNLISGTDFDVINLLFVGAIGNRSNLTSYIEKIKHISFSRELNVHNTNEYDLAIKLLEFWNGSKFEYKTLDFPCYIDDFLKIVFEFDNGTILYDDFVTRLQSLKNVHIASILNWDRIEMMFQDIRSIKWLIILIDKMSLDEFDINFMKHNLINFYIKILNNKKIVSLSQFDELDKKVIERFDTIDLYYLSSAIRVNIYKDFNDNLDKLFATVVNNFDELSFGNSDKKAYIYMLVEYMIDGNILFLREKLLEIINSDNFLSNNGVLLFGVSFGNLEMLNLYYDKILDHLLQCFESGIINDLDYKIIAAISSKTVSSAINNEFIRYSYFYNDDIRYILKDVEDTRLVDVYKKLKIITENNHHDDYKEEDIIWLLAHDLFFSHIEEKNAGKLIKIPVNAGIKEIIETMEKVIGYDITKEKISKILNGTKLNNSLWFNYMSLHVFLKEIEKGNGVMFKNSVNQLIKNDFLLFHISSLVLAIKIGLVDIITDDNRVFITNTIYDEINYKFCLEIEDLSDGITSDRVNYDDLIESLKDIVCDMLSKKRVKHITRANSLGIKEVDRINRFDSDIIKFFCDFDESKNYFIISDDPAYYDMPGFNSRSFGLYSYIIMCHLSKNINDEQLFMYTQKLYEYNYSFNASSNIRFYLLKLSDNDYVRKTLEILNNENSVY